MGNDFAKSIPLTVFGAAAFIGGLLSITLPETVNKKLPDTIVEAHHFERYGYFNYNPLEYVRLCFDQNVLFYISLLKI